MSCYRPVMHEYSIVQSLLELVQEQAQRHGAQRVRRVKIRVGELAGVVPELIETAFEFARVGTVCETAQIEVERVAAQWRCPTCDRAFAPGEPLACEACGVSAKLVAGEELDLMNMELEVG